MTAIPDPSYNATHEACYLTAMDMRKQYVPWAFFTRGHIVIAAEAVYLCDGDGGAMELANTAAQIETLAERLAQDHGLTLPVHYSRDFKPPTRVSHPKRRPGIMGPELGFFDPEAALWRWYNETDFATGSAKVARFGDEIWITYAGKKYQRIAHTAAQIFALQDELGYPIIDGLTLKRAAKGVGQTDAPGESQSIDPNAPRRVGRFIRVVSVPSEHARIPSLVTYLPIAEVVLFSEVHLEQPGPAEMAIAGLNYAQIHCFGDVDDFARLLNEGDL